MIESRYGSARGISMDIGLGLCGAVLEYHLHNMVLAVGIYLCAFAVLLMVPVCANYVAGNYTEYASQAAVAMGVYRLDQSIAIPFFFKEWEKAVSAGWVLGTATFLNLLAGILIALVCWKGP